MYKYLVFLLFVTLYTVFAQNVVINEVISSNKTTILDEDGEASDWIELYNKGAAPVNLSGYSLSDDTLDIQKWKFGSLVIDPGKHVLVFASDKDRGEILVHWETVISKGDTWKYKIGSASIPANWIAPSYNDAAWDSGPSGFGYGDNDDSTNLQAQSPFTSLFIRKKFSVPDLHTILKCVLHIDYDDGFVAYINGVEVARAGMGTPGSQPAWNAFATGHEAVMFTGGKPERFNIDSIKSLLVEGENTIAIQVHNTNSTSTDLSLIPFLSFGMSEAPPGSAGSPDILGLNITSSYLHTNFKISASGERIFLSDTAGNVIDLADVPALPQDISYGRISDGALSWEVQLPSPNAANTGEEFAGYADTVLVSQLSGFYPSAVSVELSAGESRIFYTLDGSDADSTKTEYTAPINIQKTSVLKAISLKPNHLPGKKITRTYFINESTDLPVVSLSTDSLNLFDYNYGIYADGPGWTSADPHYGANYWMDWERPAHIEFFDDEKNLGFSEECGIAIYGAWSRAHAQKSFAVKFNNDYGAEKIEYPLFPNFDVTTFKSFILRNSGNDFYYTHMRDAMMHMLIKDLDIDYLEYRPATTFINGEYWGIYNIREKINEHYIANRYGVDPDNIDMMEYSLGTNVVHGNADHYQQLIDYISTSNMTTDAAYNFINSMIDLDECILYFAAQAYYNNRDWPGNNNKFWRAKSGPYSKWRWIIYDLDFGFNLYNDAGHTEDHIAFMFSPVEQAWGNPPWATLLQRKLVENPRIKNQFINQIADLLNTNFKSDRVVDVINDMANHIDNEISKHRARFGIGGENTDRMITFAQERPAYLRTHVRNKFGSGSNGNIILNSTVGGKIKLNTLSLQPADFPWTGIYFQNNPVHLKAIPNSGYKFDGWTGDTTTQNGALSLSVKSNTTLTASFSQDTTTGNNIVINEINYHSSELFDAGDWIELYNNSNSIVDVSNWVFSDSDTNHRFTFPGATIIDPGQYLVLVENDSAFTSRFPDVTNYIGETGFGLNGSGEHIQLTNEAGQIIDSLTYDDATPWPMEPDGSGPTLELFNAESNNTLGENWKASIGHGSPGELNTILVPVEKQKNISIPDQYLLYQNYPNPFNPTTTIEFDVPTTSFITLKIFDVLGREVASLISREVMAGRYSHVWDATTYASGIYFYSLQTKNFKTVKKLLLQK